MTKINTIKRKRNGQQNSGLYKPIIMLNSLAIIFAINALLSWVECTFSSPTHRDYLRYYTFVNNFKPRNVIILAIILSIIAGAIYAVGVRLNNAWSASMYFNYFVLFFDIIAITYSISGHFTATHKLSLFNLLLAICLYGLALSYYLSSEYSANVKRAAIVFLIISIITAVASYILKVGIVAFIVYFIVFQLVCSIAYIIQPATQLYVANKMRSYSMLSSNIQAIFHIPFAIIDTIKSERG